MDDFDDYELDYEDDDDTGSTSESYDSGDSESIKDKYDRAKEKYDDFKEKYDNYKNKKNGDSNKSTKKPKTDGKKTAEDASKKTAEDASKKTAEDASKKATKDATKKATTDASKEAAKNASKEAAKETGKQVAKETGKQVGKEAAKEGAKYAVEAGLDATVAGIPVAIAIEVADWLSKIINFAKNIIKKVVRAFDEKIGDFLGVDGRVIRWASVPLLIFAIFVFIWLIVALILFSTSETATSELAGLVRAREEFREKKLILFNDLEIDWLLDEDIDVNETIATTLAQEGYTLEKNSVGNTYKSLSLKSILESYKDLDTVFTGNKSGNAARNMIKKFLKAEIDNFNNGVKWQTTNLSVNYLIVSNENFTKYSNYVNSSQKVVADGSGVLVDQTIANKNYTIKDDDGYNTLLKIPKLSDHGVDVVAYGGENKAARNFVDILEPYMQKWIIPYATYIDIQDEEFVNDIMTYIYHPVDVSLFQLLRLTKNTEFEFYLECRVVIEETTYGADGQISSQQILADFISNTKYYHLGSEELEFTPHADGGCTIKMRYVTLTPVIKIAAEPNGDPMVKKIKIKRSIGPGSTIPEITHIGGFYEIINRKYTILPIDENNTPDSSTADAETPITELPINKNQVNIDGTFTHEVTEVWNETLLLENSQIDNYKVSYYDEEDYQNLGRNISRIEWYQDSINMVSGAVDGSTSTSVTQQRLDYINEHKDCALDEMNESGVLASVKLAQGILESASGTSSLAAVYNNHFGMKAGKSWSGPVIDLKTGEFSATGSYYTTTAAFRVYGSADQSFADHSRFIWNTKGHANKAGGYRYRDATEFAKSMTFTAPDGELTYDYRGAITAIVNGGYCTDPEYVSKICAIIETYELYEIDRLSTWDGTPPAYATQNSTSGSGSSGSSSGVGNTQYSYDDMPFAFYQIDKWYLSSISALGNRFTQTVKLPDGGFAWPVDISGNDEAKKVIKLYGVDGNDGIHISTGDVCSEDIDEGLHKGAKVIATHSGVVTKVVPVTDASTYAYVEIKTDDGKYRTHYGNLSEIFVHEGDAITKNGEIGLIGNTGSATECPDIYLTYKMYYNGSRVDPLQYYYIVDSTGTRVNNYDEVEKATVASGEYSFDGPRQYLAGSSEAVDGDVSTGIEFYFTSSSGRTYNCYLQNRGPWRDMKYGDKTIAAQGCNITSVATILSGYGYSSITPATFSGGIQYTYGLIINRISNSQQYWYDGRILNGSDSGNTGGIASASAKQMMIEHLANGKPILIHDHGDNPYAGSQHWMAMLDIRESSGDYEVFVADPNYANPDRGWRSLDKMLIDLVSFMLVDY